MSDLNRSIEHMFDSSDEAGLLQAMADGQRAERVAVARRLLAAGRLCQLRMSAVDEDERFQWCIDNWEAVAAEVGAELGISRGRASAQMNYGIELLERLPKFGAVFAAGEVDFRVVVLAVFRTGLITDPTLLAAVDAAIARGAPHWNALSRNKVIECIDWQVRAVDPAAVRVARESDADRHVEIGPGRDGLAEFWGAVRATDAAVLDRRLNALADSVCRDDSRTTRQRRADALAALAEGLSTMTCDCGSADCPARGNESTPGQVVIHVVAEAATVSGASAAPGYLPGYGALPAEAVRQLASTRARLRNLTPAHQFCAEPRYRPSRALADFIRCRDLHCRFPGCDKPAEICDIDHVTPWDRGGLTHPANLALLCRAHHLLKTFWTGENGWAVTQFVDGTLSWTSPSGRLYTTTPTGALFFPRLADRAQELTVPGPPRSCEAGRTLMMPTRRRSRAAERAARVQWERGLNEARWAADPPPF